MKNQLEKEIQKAVLDYLGFLKIKAWRTNSGVAFSTYKDKTYMQRFAPPGTSDIIGITNDGRFLAIEIKLPGKENTLSKLQSDFIKEINDKGGVAFMATSLEQVREGLIKENVIV